MPKIETRPSLTDVQYALGQLRRAQANGLRGIPEDCVQRAIDALERVEAELTAPLSRDEES